MNPRRAMVAILGAAIGMVAAAALGEDGSPAPAPEHRRGEVTILHTNDWHGYALAEKPRRRRSGKRALQGGVAAVAAGFAKVRAEVGADRVLALDAGDCLSGFPAAAIEEDGVIGATFIRAWSAIGYDSWIVGNHDFDGGRKNVEAIVKLATPPCLLANLVGEDGKSPVKSEPCKVFERGGLKIGVLGLVTADLPRLATAETMEGLTVLPLARTARPLVAKLEKECDLVVALTHQGVDLDRELARAVPELDVIVGGHSHTRLTTPIVDGTTLVVQAGANGREFGRLDLTVEDGKIASHKGVLVPALAEDVTPTAAMAEPLGKIEAYMAALEAEVIGETAQALTRGNYYGETLIGGFVAEAIRDAAGVEVGLMNSGGLRGDLKKGKITRADLLKVMPNDNMLATFEVTGAELEAICLHNARAAATQDHGVLQVAGVRYRWRRLHDGKKADAEIVWIQAGGKPIDPKKTYRCATNDFIAFEQTEKYLGFEPRERKNIAKTVHGAILAAFKQGPVEAPDRGRIQEEKKKARPAEPVLAGSGEKKAGDGENDEGGD